jgi:hypothetical protein
MEISFKGRNSRKIHQNVYTDTLTPLHPKKRMKKKINKKKKKRTVKH